MERKTSKLTIALVVLLLLAAAATTAISQDNPKVIDLNALAAKGEAIANQDPLTLELRNQQPDDPSRRGFDIGMAAAEGQTLPGPGKQRIHDSLSPAEQGGFDTAVAFSLERNRNADLAARGAAIAKTDPVVAAARAVETDVFYCLGFDIATGIFGDPAQGAQGNTAVGPGSLKIRDALSVAGQRGFNASVKLHLSRRGSSSAPEQGPITSAVTSIDNFGKRNPALEAIKASLQPDNTITVRVRYRKEYGYRGDTSAFGYVGPTSCDAFYVSASLGSGRPTNPIRISSDAKMEVVSGYYVCAYLVSELPLNQTITINVSVPNIRNLSTELWKGGSEGQPPPGQERIIQNGIQNVTLTGAQPRATLVFEMVYAPIPTPPR